MLHIVQAVMWGVAERPLLFTDEAKAQAAYVEAVENKWEQRYAAYCEHHGASRDCFASAQAFVNTIEAFEKSTVHCWTVPLQEAGLADDAHCAPEAEQLRETAREIGAVREGLARLLDQVSGLADHLAEGGIPATPSAAAMKATPPAAATKAAPLPPQSPPRPEAVHESCSTPEWQTFVATIKRMCSGNRNEFYLLPRDDWRQDVYSDRTTFEYWEWVANKIMIYKEKAVQGEYAVIEDPQSPGYYKFTTPKGSASECCCESEWEAWCAAGLDREANSRTT